MMGRQETLATYLVTAEEMQRIEKRLFDAGMPVAALMEKVSERLVGWVCGHFERLLSEDGGKLRPSQYRVGVLAGPGHNGGDALVIARELHHLGFDVCVYQPFDRCKPLTQQHTNYAKHLGISFVDAAKQLGNCDAIVDGWFGFGLTRPVEGALAKAIEAINQLEVPVFSVDLPSGIHTDTGQVMGVAIEATCTACLGIWKRGFMQERTLTYFGECELIDFDIPLADIEAVLGEMPAVQRLTEAEMLAALPLDRSVTAHKYKAGQLLVIAGSRQYAGAALLTGLGAIASGVGMLTLAVPESIRLALLPQLPGALLVGCAETEEGAIASLPETLDLAKYDAIAFGPGLTATVPTLLAQLLNTDCPLLLDADGLNLLTQTDVVQSLQNRTAQTILTPHLGEFKRLFPDIYASQSEQALPGELAAQAAKASRAIVLLKGPRSAIANGQTLWFNPESTPALARGGSGDVLTGLMGGLVAAASKESQDVCSAVLSAVWWHSQAALYASRQRTLLGVDPLQLAHSLNPSLSEILSPKKALH
ncbi:MAG: NAD(P)H-hydrate dehydratase [Cyanobacteria bacterium P01_F01_bin.3]